MNWEKLLDCLGDIDDKYVKEAAPGGRPVKKRWWALAGAAAAAVLILAVTAGTPPRWADPGVKGTAEPGASEAIDDDLGCVPGCIVWHGYAYVERGYAVHEMPEGLELLGEVDLLTAPHGIMPEDAPDLSSNFGEGYAYMFPGNESLIVFRHKEWDVEEELGREEPILLMYREFEFLNADGTPADLPYYRNLAEMVNDADMIVEGIAVPAEREAGDPAGSGEDVYTVQVTNVLLGDVEAEEEIRVSVPAGSGRLETSDDNSYLLFLRRDGDGSRPVSAVQGVYSIMHPKKGAYVLVPNDDSYLMSVQGAIRNPPYTHVAYPLYGVQKRIQSLLESGQHELR